MMIMSWGQCSALPAGSKRHAVRSVALFRVDDYPPPLRTPPPAVRLSIFLVLLLLLFKCPVAVVGTPSLCRPEGPPSVPLKVILANPLTGLTPAVTSLIKAIMTGAETAFHAANHSAQPSFLLGECGNASGVRRHLELIVVDNAGNATTHVSVLQQALAAHPDALTMLPSVIDQVIEATVPVLEQHNLTMLGAQTRGEALRTYRPNLVFLSPPIPLILLSLLKFLVYSKQVRRIGFMVSVHLGRDPLEQSVNYLMYQRLAAAAIDLGAAPAGLYIADARNDYGLPSTIVPSAEMARFTAGRPQAVLMIAYPLPSTTQFIATAVGLMGPSFIFAVSDDAAAAVAQTIQTIGASQLRGRMFIGLPLLLASDVRYAAVREMHAEAAAVPGTSFDLGATGMFFIAGWLHAKFAIAVLEGIALRLHNEGRANATITRAMFNEAVLGGTPRMVNVHDLSFGAFAGRCAGPQRTLCECNEGGHDAGLGLFSDNASIVPHADPHARIRVPLGECANAAVQLPAPVFAAAPRAPSLFCVRRGDVFSDGTLQCGPPPVLSLLAGAGALPSLKTSSSSGLSVGGRPLVVYDASARQDAYARAATAADQRAALMGLRDESPLTVAALAIVVPGPAVVPPVALPPTAASSAARAAYLEAACGGVMSVEPVSVLPLAGAPHAFDPCTVRFTATPEQELHAVAAYAASRGVALRYVAAFDATGLSVTAAVVRRSAEFAARAAAARNVPVLPAIVDTAAPVANALTALGTTVGRAVIIVVGVASAADAVAVVWLLVANPEAEVVLPHAHAVLWHGALAAALNATATSDGAASAGRRLLIATALGPWNAAGAAERSPTPAAQLWGRVAAFLSPLADSNATAPISGTDLLDRLYELGTVSGPLFAAGPYSMAPCPDGAALATGFVCELASGARGVQLVRFAASDGSAASTGNAAALAHTEIFSTARGGFPAEAEGPGRGEWLWAAVGSALGVAALVAAVIGSLAIYYCRVVRPGLYAPKDPSSPFTMVFTDVQSSTALWAEIPEVMAVAIPAHHRLLRAALADHKGYEVRTIGDAFMVAFKHAGDAAAFAVAAQVALRRHDWADGGAIDALYKRLAAERDETLQQRAAQRRRSSGPSIGFAASSPPAPDLQGGSPTDTESARDLKSRRRTLSFDPTAAAAEDGSEAGVLGAEGAHQGRRVTIIESAEQGLRTKLREQERAVAREWEEDAQSEPCPWRGLRVRVGIHTDIGTITVNRTNGRFDYAGAVVAAAAAVQDAAHGGQVLLSAATHAALTRGDVKALARQVTRARERLRRDQARTERRRRFVDTFSRSKRQKPPKKITAEHLFAAVDELVPVPNASEPTAVLQLDAFTGRVFPPLRCVAATTTKAHASPRCRSGPSSRATLIPDLVVTPGASPCVSPQEDAVPRPPDAVPPGLFESSSSLPGANFSATSTLFRATQEHVPAEYPTAPDASAGSPRPAQGDTAPKGRVVTLQVPSPAGPSMSVSSGSLEISIDSGARGTPRDGARRSISYSTISQLSRPGGGDHISATLISLYLQTALNTFRPADRRALVADLLDHWGCSTTSSITSGARGSTSLFLERQAGGSNGIGDLHALHPSAARSTTLATSQSDEAPPSHCDFIEVLQSSSRSLDRPGALPQPTRSAGAEGTWACASGVGVGGPSQIGAPVPPLLAVARRLEPIIARRWAQVLSSVSFDASNL